MQVNEAGSNVTVTGRGWRLAERCRDMRNKISSAQGGSKDGGDGTIQSRVRSIDRRGDQGACHFLKTASPFRVCGIGVREVEEGGWAAYIPGTERRCVPRMAARALPKRHRIRRQGQREDREERT